MSASAERGTLIAFLNYSHVIDDVREIQESVLPEGWQLLRVEGLPHEGAVAALQRLPRDVQAVIVDYDVDRAVIDALPNLRLIQVFGVGVETIDRDYAAERGIAVCNAPGFNAISVAEYTILLALAAARNITLVDAAVRQGKWPQYEYRARSTELFGKTWGVVGFGSIGREVAKRAAAFGMRVLYYDLAPAAARSDVNAEYAELADLLAESDVVSLHVTLNEQAKHLISDAELRRMKPNAILVNTARGGVVDTEALVRALREQRIAAAGLDVFEDEPPSRDSALLALPNVVLSPHTGAGTVEGIRKVFAFCYENIGRVLAGDVPLHCVNAVALPRTFRR